MSKDLINLLLAKPGEFFSGAELSRRLKVSRTAVWKQIKGLKEKGFLIEAAPRRGYRLLELPDKLFPELFARDLKTRYFHGPYHYYDKVDSTNKVLRQLAEKGDPEGAMVVAEEQLQGKGRLGRGWSSPPGKGIWFSLLLKPPLLPEQSSCLTLLAGVAVQETILQVTGLETKIKWPNDILCGRNKICGILTEINAEMDALHYLVIGIGLNVNQEKNDFPCGLAEASSLKESTGLKQDRNKLLHTLLQKLDNLYHLFLQKGFPPIKTLWKEKNITLGQEILVHRYESTFTAHAIDINDNGGLVINTPEKKTKIITAGEVSLKKSNCLEEGNK